MIQFQDYDLDEVEETIIETKKFWFFKLSDKVSITKERLVKGKVFGIPKEMIRGLEEAEDDFGTKYTKVYLRKSLNWTSTLYVLGTVSDTINYIKAQSNEG